jgi:hypothetical protein
MYKFFKLFFIFFLLQNTCYAQRKNSLQIFALPIIQKIGNLDKQYTSISHPAIDAHYSNIPGFSYGLQFLRQRNEKWGWGIGFDHIFQNYTLDFKLTNTVTNYTYFTFRKKIKTQELALRYQLSYVLTKKLTANFILALKVPVTYKYDGNGNLSRGALVNDFIFTPDTSYAYTSTNINYTVFEDHNPLIQLFLPELSFSYNFYNNFNLQVGMKLKFFQLDKENGLIDVRVKGFIGKENAGTNKLLHESHIQNTNIAYYAGLSYDIPLRKKQKLKVE